MQHNLHNHLIFSIILSGLLISSLMHSQTGSQRGGDHGNMGRRVSIGGIRRCSVSVVNRRTSVLGGGGIAVNGIKEVSE